MGSELIIPDHTERATTFCRSAAPQTQQYSLKDNKVKGLELRVAKSVKAWSLRYRVKVGEKWGNRRLPLGDFPAVTVAAARAAAEKAKTDIARGQDPMNDRQVAAQRRADEIEATALEQASIVTVEVFFERWMKSGKPKNRKDGGAELRRTFASNVLPLLGSLEMKKVTQANIFEVTDAILDRAIPGSKQPLDRTALIVFSELKQFFKFAVKRGIIAENPAGGIAKAEVAKKPKTRDRVLDPKEIRTMDQMMRSSSLNRPAQIAMCLSLATLCRINELGKAQWQEIDWDRRQWTIPGHRTKNGKALTVNLSLHALGLFRELQAYNGDTAWCLTNTKRDGPLHEKTITNHARDRQLPIGQKCINGRTIQTRSLASGETPWKPHDLRRSGTTLMQQLGIAGVISERCLNHAEENHVAAIYHRHDFNKEMKRAWFLLGEALSVITGPDGESFLKEVDEDYQRDPEDEIGFLALVKKYYKKPETQSEVM